MGAKKITGIIVLVVGVCCFIFGTIIALKVKQGYQEINKAQQNVNTAKKVSRINPYSHQVSKVISKPIEEKIQEGRDQAGAYKVLSVWLRLGGIVIFITGACLLIFGKKSRN